MRTMRLVEDAPKLVQDLLNDDFSELLDIFSLHAAALGRILRNKTIHKAKNLCKEVLLITEELCHAFRSRQFLEESVDVFICHCGKQKDNYRRLQEKLQGIGLSVFLDEWSFGSGQPRTLRRIVEAVLSCKIGLIVASKEFFESEYCLLELFVFCVRLKETNSITHQDDSFFVVPDYFEEEHYGSTWVESVQNLPLPKVFGGISGIRREKQYISDHVDCVFSKIMDLIGMTPTLSQQFVSCGKFLEQLANWERRWRLLHLLPVSEGRDSVLFDLKKSSDDEKHECIDFLDFFFERRCITAKTIATKWEMMLRVFALNRSLIVKTSSHFPGSRIFLSYGEWKVGSAIAKSLQEKKYDVFFVIPGMQSDEIIDIACTCVLGLISVTSEYLQNKSNVLHLSILAMRSKFDKSFQVYFVFKSSSCQLLSINSSQLLPIFQCDVSDPEVKIRLDMVPSMSPYKDFKDNNEIIEYIGELMKSIQPMANLNIVPTEKMISENKC
jgi:hypothetical protein